MSRRPGIALPIVLLAMVVIGVLVAGSFFGSVQEHRIGRSAIEATRTTIGADHGLAAVLDTWASSGAIDLKLGGSLNRTYELHEGVTMSTVITRVGHLAFWVESRALATGEGHDVGARRRIGAMVQVRAPAIPLPAALTIRLPPGTQGTLGSTRQSGVDEPPADWGDCPVGAPPVAGFATPDLRSWFAGGDSGCGPLGCQAGDPPRSEPAGIGDTAASRADFDDAWAFFAEAGGIDLPGGAMVGTPDRPLGPIEIDGRCDTTVLENWGDPWRITACASRFPVVRAAGDLIVAGGRGQGVLLVDGDLELRGAAEFAGLILVRGSLHTVDWHGTVYGAVRVAGEGARGSSLSGTGRFAFSRCALGAALAANGPPVVVPGSWTVLHR